MVSLLLKTVVFLLKLIPKWKSWMRKSVSRSLRKVMAPNLPSTPHASVSTTT
ncbi:unnamed protein product [Brassica oleracea var. botrytis]|uniref:Uncharacterized protein n=1 Tax=Brassica oleracea TaxID=3712 RepID=A0A3P6CI10_BRAOL|nr:unnamed protein product [Brassica oleracea]